MKGRPAFDVDVAREVAGATVTVRGDMDIATIGRLEIARNRALADGPESVRIDLSAVEFVDSSGLRFLLETHSLSKRGGWTLQLVRPPSSAMRAFEIAGVDRFLPFVDRD
jgi:anti-sigma B factor antagonist